MSRHAAAPPTIAARFGCVLLAAGAFGLASLAVVALLSALYSSASADVVRHTGGRVDATPTARLGTRLAPWRADAFMQLARSASVIGRRADALAATESALVLRPSDAYVWVYLARLRGSGGRYGARTVGMYRMALSRAPSALGVHEAIAMDGVLRWRHGGEELRELWLASMAFTLERRRKPFLQAVAGLGRDPYFCAATQERLGIERWCRQAALLRANCGRTDLPRGAEQWCRNVGLVPPERTGGRRP